jgi:hypothetical protein
VPLAPDAGANARLAEMRYRVTVVEYVRHVVYVNAPDELAAGQIGREAAQDTSRYDKGLVEVGCVHETIDWHVASVAEAS